MKIALIFALIVALLVPSAAAAQTLDSATGIQAENDLWNEVLGSSALELYRQHNPESRFACDPIDPDARAQALTELSLFDQRATDLANRTSGNVHVRAMTIQRSISNAFYALMYPVVPDRCYVATE